MNQNYIEKFVIQEFLEEKLFKKDGWIKKRTGKPALFYF